MSSLPRFAARPSRRAFLGACSALPLAGCLGGPSSGLLADVGAAGGEALALNVITTRQMAAGGQSPFYESGRSPTMSYARAVLAGPDRTGFGRIGALVKSDLGVIKIEPKSGDASRNLAESLRGRDTLLFVHGYNQTFEAAAIDTVILSKGISFNGNAVLFSWASKGGLLDYVYDRESAMVARDHLADALTAVLSDPFGARVHLVAHSMGTLVLLEALRAYRDRRKDEGFDRIGAIVLASPDLDLDVFKANLSRLGRLREKITVITATSDRALGVSRRLAGGERVGALPRQALEGLGINVVDATDFASGLIRHDAFLADADVRGVIRRAVERG